jgi:hypothetical protein
MDSVRLEGKASRGVPAQSGEGTLVPQRLSRYGEVHTLPYGKPLYGPADEGRYMVLRNATPGTGIAGHAAPTTIDDTKPLLYLRNDATVAEGKRIYLDYIKLDVTAAGTNATDLGFQHILDVRAAPSAGTQLTAVNANGDSSEAPSLTAWLGAAVVAAASTSVRRLAHGLARLVIPVVGDTYRFDFGAGSQAMGSMIDAGTAIANIVIPVHPIVIAPGQSYLLHQRSSAQSGAHSFEFECGFWVR